MSKEKLAKKVHRIELDIKKIKENLADMVLTKDDLKALDKAEQEYEQGRTVRLKF